MLDGVTPVPPDPAARYRARGYWEDRPLFEGFTGALATYADRVAVVDEAGPVTYRELSDRSAHLARLLLDEGFGPLDRIIVQLPNTAMFGSDHPSLPYERILREWDELGYDQSVLELVFHANAERVLGL
jgi:non-ribosomal peptide synthetase component E (peptide arylation enzyme)